MPVKLERKLRKQAHRLGKSVNDEDAYVYGTLRKTGWKPSSEKHKKLTFGSKHKRR